MSDHPFRSATPDGGVEAMIRSAADYVQPTDDLRARTLETACDRGARRRARWRSVVVAIALIALPTVAVPLARACFPPPAAAVSAAELHRRASDIATHRGGGLGWGLFDAFRLLRDEQAERLGVDRPRE